MLGKLFKTEFKASGRLYLPLFICVIFFATVERILIEIMDMNNAESTALTILFVAITAIFGIIIFSVCVSGQFISIYRFYKSVFTDEGYLTNTLPVKPSRVVFSKLLVGVLYTVFSWIVLLISGFIIVAGEMLTNFLDEMEMSIGLKNTNVSLMDFVLRSLWNMKLTIALLMLLAIVSLFFNILIFYISFAIGNMANRKKVLLSIIIYIVIINALVFAGAGIAMFVDWLSLGDSMLVYDIINITLAIILAGTIIGSLICYFLTNKIIKSKLNLE